MIQGLSASRLHLRFIALTLVIAIATSGCTSMRPVPAVNAPAPPKQYGDIKPGNRVGVEMKDGTRESFRVHSIDADAVVSTSGARYLRTEMLQLRRAEFSHLKTWPLIAGVLTGSLLVAVYISYQGRRDGFSLGR